MSNESQDNSPEESSYFNDLSQQPSKEGEGPAGDEATTNGQVPKPKRIACVLCRKRKLKCDGGKPSCGTCARLQHECSYDEVRRKSGPKRGYVKALEARLAQVETLLKGQDEVPPMPQPKNWGGGKGVRFQQQGNSTQAEPVFNLGESMATSQCAVPGAGDAAPGEEHFPWEMIGLGLDEPLPTQDVVNDLDATYFEKVHPSQPMIHRPRYHAAMNLAPHMRPPVCLRYAMWANAAAVSDKYENLQEHFYQRARKYIQQDEMKGHGESMITIAHCQTWTLIATYEFKLMYFPRAWMSAGRACRMTQMMGLHRLDGAGLDVKQCLPPPRDWTEREERRRTFWAAFCVDRYSSIGTGWPMTIEEKDVMSTMPSSEEAYELNKSQKTPTLQEALSPEGATKLTGFSGVILMACLFGRNLTHLHRPEPDDADDDLNGEFWKRHRMLDNILLNTALALPVTLRLPSGLNDPNTVFLNMCIHTSTICLHQAAIFKADKNRMSSRISAESKVRCITAAAEIASIMRQICHLDLSAMNPFISFCLYVSARVFVQYLKSRPKDTQIRSSLQFLLQAMQAIKRRNPLTESFLVQLDVDLEAAGIEDTSSLRVQQNNTSPMGPNRSEACPMQQIHLDHRPNYGDMGLAAYNDPSGNPNLNSTSAVQPTFNFNTDNTEMTEESLDFMAMGGTFDLPNRPAGHQSPGSSNQSSGIQRSPQSYDPAMDISPDADHLTPNSSTHQTSSGHASTHGYSPKTLPLWQPDQIPTAKMQSQTDPARLTSMLGNNMDAYTDFDMNAFSASNPGNDMNSFPTSTDQSGFVLPSNWGSGSGGTGLTPGNTGMTPGPTGFTPGASGMGDMLNMSDAEWNSIMENMQFGGAWETGVEHNENILQERQRR
ncbi:uncharacterized protein LTR77_006595 [Saxophila tyrrhenica]|uniref:Zn(2)-C6 fungal-type domain-containing protein n=1 Tax=Saxophila tyrrhenica TaxID=1690608 RepID=A0AAV9P878_9PEZI|nr:hypothetical protein LTR77_006595 [Saxophila tyrrhenica]